MLEAERRESTLHCPAETHWRLLYLWPSTVPYARLPFIRGEREQYSKHKWLGRAFRCCLMGLVVSTCVGDESVLAIMLGSNHVISSEPALGSAVASWGWWCRRASEMKAC
ncbi:hypothetical protein MRX96_009897 [Rhipicephalus microplus]